MGYYIRRLFNDINHKFASREEIVECAEAALRVQLLLAKDVLAITERLQIPEEYKIEDRRIQRARDTVRRLG
jgi:hypothetical protein